MHSTGLKSIRHICCGFFFILLISSVNPSTAQNLPKASVITTDNGLSFRDVTALTMDSRGLMWFGSTQGIERFDGADFLIFNSKKNADINFQGEKILKSGMVLLDKLTMLIVADEKLYTLDLRSNKFERIFLPDAFGLKVLTLHKSLNASTFIVTENETTLFLLKYNKSGVKLITKSRKARLNLSCVGAETSGTIWWSTPSDGLLKISSDGKLLATFKPDSINWYGSKLYTTPFFIDKYDQMYLFPKSVNEVWKYDPGNNTKEILAAGLETPVYFALEDSQGYIWFAGKKQLLKYARFFKSNNVVNISDHLIQRLNYTLINDLFEDNTHILWIATNNGIIKLPLGNQSIQNFLVVKNQEWGNEMRSIFETKDKSIYSFCENGNIGLYKLNPIRNEFDKVKLMDDEKKDHNILEHAKHFIYLEKKDRVYFLTDHLYSIDLNKNLIKAEFDFTDITERLNHNPLAMLDEHTFILGAKLPDLHLFDVENKRKTKVFHDFKGGKQIVNECFIVDNFGAIWVGTSEGIFIINRNGEILHQLNISSTPALNNNHILCFLKDMNGNIWAGTFGGGLHLIKFSNTTAKSGIPEKNKYQNLKVIYFSKEQGLCDENITSILEDNNGRIWAATYNGLSSYSPEQNIFQTYIESDGISANEFNYTSALKDSDHLLWFGGMNGVNRIDPSQATINQHTPALVLTSFLKYNRKKQNPERTIIFENSQIKAFEISPYDSWFQFNWALPSYLKSDKNNYYVRLEGLNDEWIYNGHASFIRYNSLPHGKYILHVKGADSKGNWSPVQISVPIIVHPFFYQTWLFMFIVLLVAGGVIYILFQYNLQKRLEIEQMRTQIASDLHDELGSMLSGLAMQSELLQSEDGSKNLIRLEYISKISRDIIGKMRDLVWSIDSRRDSIEALIERMKEQADDIFQGKEVEYIFEIGDIGFRNPFSIKMRQHLFLIYNEALTNIIRHTEATRVLIRIGNFGSNFELSIFNDGLIEGKSTHITGMGKVNMEMRAKKLGAEILFEQSEGFLVKLWMKKL